MTLPKDGHRRRGSASTKAYASDAQDLIGFAAQAQLALLVYAGGTVRHASPTATRMLAVKGRSLAGKTLASLLPDLGVSPNHKVHTAPSAGTAPVEIEAIRLDGKRLRVEVQTGTIPWDGARASFALLTDVSARKEQELNRLHAETKYRDLVESAPHAIAVVRGGSILMANLAFAKLFGFDAAGGVPRGLGFSSLLAAGERGRFRRLPGREAKGEYTLAQSEFEALRQDGTPIRIELSAARIQWEGHAADAYTAMDVTHRHRVEADLREGQRQLRSIIDALPQMVTVKDRKLRVRFLNAATLQFYGLPSGELIGRSLDELPKIRRNRDPALARSEQIALRRKAPVALEAVRLVRHDGDRRWYRTVKVPLL